MYHIGFITLWFKPTKTCSLHAQFKADLHSVYMPPKTCLMTYSPNNLQITRQLELRVVKKKDVEIEKKKGRGRMGDERDSRWIGCQGMTVCWQRKSITDNFGSVVTVLHLYKPVQFKFSRFTLGQLFNVGKSSVVETSIVFITVVF